MTPRTIALFAGAILGAIVVGCYLGAIGPFADAGDDQAEPEPLDVPDEIDTPEEATP